MYTRVTATALSTRDGVVYGQKSRVFASPKAAEDRVSDIHEEAQRAAVENLPKLMKAALKGFPLNGFKLTVVLDAEWVGKLYRYRPYTDPHLGTRLSCKQLLSRCPVSLWLRVGDLNQIALAPAARTPRIHFYGADVTLELAIRIGAGKTTLDDAKQLLPIIAVVVTGESVSSR